MTAERSSATPTTPMTVVLDAGDRTSVSLELLGPLDAVALEEALARVAAGHPGAPTEQPRLVRRGPDHHTLRLTAAADDLAPYPAGQLADLLTLDATALVEPVREEPAPVHDDVRSGPWPDRAARGGPGGRGRLPELLAITPLQRERLADAVAHPGHQIEQLTWRWHGPLETVRFTAAWQSVFDRETVLRSAFVWDPHPRAVLFDRARPDVARHACGSVADRNRDPELVHLTELAQLMERERERGFDLRRPGMLRAALLDTEPAESTELAGLAGSVNGRFASGYIPPTDVLLTYHRALLDARSVRVLLQEFYRAYLEGGTLPGGERRPDLRDYTRWLDRQDQSSARDFWTRGTGHGTGRSTDHDTDHGTDAALGTATPGTAAPESATPGTAAPGAATPDAAAPDEAAPDEAPHAGTDTGAVPARLPRAGRGAATGNSGTGYTRARLSSSDAARLSDWAARWGATESSALQAVWAMLLYRASRVAPGPVQISFGVTVSGRGIPLDGIERIPGPFDNPLPMTVEIAPELSVPGLLRALTDRALDMAAYEWVSAGQIHAWRGRSAEPEPAETLLVFEQRLLPVDGLAAALAAQGIRVENPVQAGARTAFPIGVVAHHDGQAGLVLTSVHDRARLADGQAEAMLSRSAQLLRELPWAAGESTTVAAVLDMLRGSDVPRMHEPPAEPGGPLAPLRAGARPGAGTVCLIAPPGARDTCHARLVEEYEGPHAIVALRATPDNTGDCARALRPLLDTGAPLVLGGFSGAGAVAYEIVRRLTAEGARAPLVVLGDGGGAGGESGDPAGVRALARAVRAAADGEPGRPFRG